MTFSEAGIPPVPVFLRGEGAPLNLRETGQVIFISSAMVIEAEVLRWLLGSGWTAAYVWPIAVAIAILVPCALLMTHKDD
jgi:hypothetical protein